jgi:c(7)-type cytochrome triheme protein
MTRRYILLAISLIVFVGFATFVDLPSLMAGSAPPPSMGNDEQTLKFSHKMHIKDIGVDCATCHPGAATSKLSSDNLASTHDQCSSCHQDQVTSDCGFCHKNPENIVPRPAVERTVIFSHENHLGRTDVECTTCHKGLDEVELSSAKNMPDMAACNTCHDGAKAPNTCENCHTDFVTLLPADHKKSDFLRSHRDEIRLGAFATSCQTCHSETFCQQCHTGAGLKAFRKQDLMVEPRPKVSTKDTPKRTVLQNVHDLNYRFTHGIDARSKQTECGSCHSTQTFCADCHKAGGNISQGTFKPKSHSVPGFTTLGLGSGGGLHAEEARRDIESCMSCHDVEGRDPTCMTCHLESGRVR